MWLSLGCPSHLKLALGGIFGLRPLAGRTEDWCELAAPLRSPTAWARSKLAPRHTHWENAGDRTIRMAMIKR